LNTKTQETKNKERKTLKDLFKKKKKDPNALKTRRVFSNVFFALKTVHSVAPSYLPTYFLWSVGNSLLGFLTNTWLLREVVNRYQQGSAARELLWMVVVIVAAEILWGRLIGLLYDILYPRYQQRIVEKVQSDLFRKAESVELECYETPGFYDKYVKAMDGAYNKCMSVVYSVDTLIYAVVTLFSCSILLFVIDPVLIVFGLIPLFFGMIRNKRNKGHKERGDAFKPLDRREAYVQRTFYLNEYAKEMRLGGIHKLMLQKYGETMKNYMDVFRKYGFKLVILQFLMNSSAYITEFGAMLYAAFRTLVMKTMLLGDCLVVFNSIGQVSWALTRMTGVMTEFRDHAMYIEDYRFFLAYEPKIKRVETGKKAEKGDIALSGVSFTYAGAKKPALQNVSMKIRQGEKIALVGHNGSGKTTLVKLLLHLYEPKAGRITLNGIPVKEYATDSYKAHFTTVFQDFKMFSMSVAENVLLRPLREGDEETVTQALKKSGAYDKVMSLKNGIHTTLTREFDPEGAVLSVGEAQKVSLARAFTNDSPVVILDEPSSALDPIAEYNMFKNMLEACEDRTLIFISHRLSSAVLADRIFLMEDGCIKESGTHRELMKKNGKYAQMFRMQAENYGKTESEVKSHG